FPAMVEPLIVTELLRIRMPPAKPLCAVVRLLEIELSTTVSVPLLVIIPPLLPYAELSSTGECGGIEVASHARQWPSHQRSSHQRREEIGPQWADPFHQGCAGLDANRRHPGLFDLPVERCHLAVKQFLEALELGIGFGRAL